MTGLAERLRRSFADEPECGEQPYLDDAGPSADMEALIPAAVLVPIVDAAVPRMLLTVRHAGLRAHAGQVAFPGGRVDPEDDGPVAAALRESWEEVGLAPEHVQVVGTARAYATITGYLIRPVVAVIPDGLSLQPHEAEVAGVFEVPLDHLLADANHLRRQIDHEGRLRHYYEIDWPAERIWGVTARLIVHLAPRLRAVMALPA